MHIHSQKGTGIEERVMGIPGRDDCIPRATEQGNHRLDAQSGSSCTVERHPASIEGSGIFLGLTDDALRLKKGIRPADLRNIIPGRLFQRTSRHSPLMSGHMEPHRTRFGILL